MEQDQANPNKEPLVSTEIQHSDCSISSLRKLAPHSQADPSNSVQPDQVIETSFVQKVYQELGDVLSLSRLDLDSETSTEHKIANGKDDVVKSLETSTTSAITVDDEEHEGLKLADDHQDTMEATRVRAEDVITENTQSEIMPPHQPTNICPQGDDNQMNPLDDDAEEKAFQEYQDYVIEKVTLEVTAEVVKAIAKEVAKEVAKAVAKTAEVAAKEAVMDITLATTEEVAKKVATEVGAHVTLTVTTEVANRITKDLTTGLNDMFATGEIWRFLQPGGNALEGE